MTVESRQFTKLVHREGKSVDAQHPKAETATLFAHILPGSQVTAKADQDQRSPCNSLALGMRHLQDMAFAKPQVGPLFCLSSNLLANTRESGPAVMKDAIDVAMTIMPAEHIPLHMRMQNGTNRGQRNTRAADGGV